MSSRVLHAIKPLLGISLLAALLPVGAFEPGNSDLPVGLTEFNGTGARTTGTVESFNIPLIDYPETIHFEVRGADGGAAQAGPNSNKAKFKALGGGGATFTATFTIDPSASNGLRPGGEIRIIVGNKGADKQGGGGGTRVAAGGGGGSGVLYRGPEPNSEWEPLIIAGGGGGAAVNSYSTRVIKDKGDNGQIGTAGSSGNDYGDWGSQAGGGGSDGGSGGSAQTGGEGGAGWLADGNRGAMKGDPSGGNGGYSNYQDRGSNGGFGCSGGGGAGGEAYVTIKYVGGGGGGGYSGGGAGAQKGAGGGGGSMIDGRALNDLTKTTTTGNGSARNGQIKLTPSAETVADQELLPVITLDGDESQVLLLSTDSYIDPGATAVDYYGNTLTVQVSPDTVDLNSIGNYEVLYEATDQFDQTVEVNRSVVVVAPFSPPRFIVDEEPSSTVLFSEGAATLLAGTVVSDAQVEVEYALAGIDAGHFSLDPDTGELFFKAQPDFDVPGDYDADTLYEITVTVSSPGHDALSADLTVLLTDVDEPVSAPTLDNLTVEENQTYVGTVTAEDPEGEDVTFSLGTFGDSSFFTITPDTGELSFIAPVDYENPFSPRTASLYSVQVRAEDSQQSTSQTFYIHVRKALQTSIAEFRSAFGLAADGSDDFGDLSGNGVPNIYYHLFGMVDPNGAAQKASISDSRSAIPGMPSVALTDDGDLTFYHTICVTEEDYTVFPMFSSDLTNWEAYRPFQSGPVPVFRPYLTRIAPVGDHHMVVGLHFLKEAGPEGFPHYPKLFSRIAIEPLASE